MQRKASPVRKLYVDLLQYTFFISAVFTDKQNRLYFILYLYGVSSICVWPLKGLSFIAVAQRGIVFYRMFCRESNRGPALRTLTTYYTTRYLATETFTQMNNRKIRIQDLEEHWGYHIWMKTILCNVRHFRNGKIEGCMLVQFDTLYMG